jgi:ElaB/YqjD/DUF883 family membrane-anchored ribosome-binding protein
MTDNTDHRSPDEIERDIRATQEDMSRTVEQIEGELSGRNILNSLLDKADENGIDARYLIDAARRNPLALGMIAAGGLWLVSDADARPSAIKMPLGGGRSGGKYPDSRHDSWHPEHRSYVEHMASCERQPGEDDQSYRSRRDLSRANYFMIEQGHDEDETSFRKRLDEATDKLRERRDHAVESARHMADHTREQAKHAVSKAEGFYSENPLISGLAAAFVGAIAGSALPATRTEEHYVGGMGEDVLDAAKSQLRRTGEEARHKKDEMIDRFDENVGGGSSMNESRSTSTTV